jgi:hypothetical protein
MPSLLATKFNSYFFIKLSVCLIALMAAGIAVSRLAYPFDVGLWEGVVWEPARLIASGHNPYNFGARPPFVMAPYGPIYYLIVGLGLNLFGHQFWFGRALSVVAMCVCLVCVARLATILTRRNDEAAGNREAAPVAMLAVLSSLSVQYWIAVQRPDLIALAFAFAGLTIVFQARPEAPDRITARSWVVVALFVAAYLCKQTVFLPVGVAALRYFQLRKPKQAVFILGMTVAVCTLVVLALNVFGEGGHFWQHFVLASDVPRRMKQIVRNSQIMLGAATTWIMLLVIIVPVLVWLARSFIGREAKLSVNRSSLLDALKSPATLIWAYLVAASTIALATSSLVGAYINYWLEPSLVASIVFALIWTRIRSSVGEGRRWPLLILLCLTLNSGYMLQHIGRREYFRWSSVPYYNEIVTTLYRSTAPGDTVFSQFPEVAVYARRAYHFGDSYQYIDGRSVELKNLFREALASKRYAAIVWTRYRQFPGYRYVPTSTPHPEKGYRFYLYVREP